MRAFFLLLVLANLMYFAYAQVTREDVGARSRIVQLQVAPEAVKLLKAGGQSVGDRAKAPGRAIPPVPPPSAFAAPGACLEWGVFAGPGVAKAEAAIAKLELPPERVERVVSDVGGYWVHMPPQKTRADADRKVGELKELGVTEFFMVQEPGQWRFAISLGIFRTDEAAQAFLAGLKQRGVRSAVVARRDDFLKQTVFYVREPGEATVARLALLRQDFPESEIKASPCPPTKG